MSSEVVPPTGCRLLSRSDIVPASGPVFVWAYGDGPWIEYRVAGTYRGQQFNPAYMVPFAIPDRASPEYDEGGVV